MIGPNETRKMSLVTPVERGHATGPMHADDTSVELSERRTGMSFQRTRMSADRTLMSVLRTSLAMISFGFTIFQFFHRLADSKLLRLQGHAPRNFGLALVLLGVGMLVSGIGYHIAFMRGLRGERAAMKDQGLIHAESAFPASLTLIVAIVLLLIGVLAVISISSNVGPFN